MRSSRDEICYWERMKNMAQYRDNLPITTGDVFISDGGLETALVFKGGWALPHNAAFVLLESHRGRRSLIEYYGRYLLIARQYNVGFVLESPTWRASPRWMAKMGCPREAVAHVNGQAVALLRDIRANASPGSHAELEATDTLDQGDPEEFGRQYRTLR